MDMPVLAPLLMLGVLASLTGLAALAFPPAKAPNPSNAWRGPFYVDKHDPRLIVPSRLGLRGTINYGHRYAKPLVTLSIVIGALTLTLLAIAAR